MAIWEEGGRKAFIDVWSVGQPATMGGEDEREAWPASGDGGPKAAPRTAVFDGHFTHIIQFPRTEYVE